MPTLHSWRCTETLGGKKRSHTLRWKLSEAAAEEWQRHPDNAGKTLEKVPGSAEQRATGGGYSGWGQAIQSDPSGRIE